jgi:Uma2 family endonuclease
LRRGVVQLESFAGGETDDTKQRPVTPSARLHAFTVEEYHRLLALGIVREEEHVELFEGYLVHHLPRSAAEENGADGVNALLCKLKPPSWVVHVQQTVTLGDSELDADLVLLPGTQEVPACNPGGDIGLVVEVADWTLESDRADKGRIYARAALPVYWIINLRDRRVEVYSSPSGTDAAPAYRHRQDFTSGESVPLVLQGEVIAHLPVADLLG